ncbi:MAG: class I SAM-dependent methyltransferase [Rhodospirillaceae bacterium]|nr:class I SAM-dependent methyltransferase [Rhodospirillaceae bacterium]
MTLNDFHFRSDSDLGETSVIRQAVVSSPQASGPVHSFIRQLDDAPPAETLRDWLARLRVLDATNPSLWLTLARLHGEAGDRINQERVLREALRVPDKTPRAYMRLFQMFKDLNRVESLLNLVSDPDTATSNPLAFREEYYPLSRCFNSIRARTGTSSAIARAQELFAAEHLQAALRNSLASAPETRKALLDFGHRAGGRIQAGVLDLTVGRAEKLIGLYETLERPSGATLECLQDPIELGRDSGHPLWHALNPFFLLWSAAATQSNQGQNVQSGWRNNAAVRDDQFHSEATATFDDEYIRANPASAHLLNLVHRVTGDRGTVIDIGCGYGEWLRFLRDHSGVTLDRLFGADIHQGRVDVAKTLLLDGLDSDANKLRTATKALDQNLFQLDLLAMDGIAVKAELGPIDILCLMAITGCFSDDQIAGIIAQIARVGARYIFQTTVLERWGMWCGRENEPEMFASHGYNLVERHWLGIPLPEDLVGALAIPGKHWPNWCLFIYERDEAT